VIPPEYLNELSLLQDRIAPFSTEEAFRIIEKELGMPVDVLFSEITPKPIAAASLGQVNKLSILLLQKSENFISNSFLSWY
jgi:aarF domain-containing kinase